MTIVENECCEEYAALSTSRRNLLRGALASGTTTIIGDPVMGIASAASGRKARGVMVVLSLRRAADGMSLVVPHGDPVYYEARPRIAVPTDQLIAADAFFGMHPALAPLLPLWSSGKLGWVHAPGLPDPHRSHRPVTAGIGRDRPGRCPGASGTVTHPKIG